VLELSPYTTAGQRRVVADLEGNELLGARVGDHERAAVVD
jgi:hypothetical protein